MMIQPSQSLMGRDAAVDLAESQEAIHPYLLGLRIATKHLEWFTTPMVANGPQNHSRQ